MTDTKHGPARKGSLYRTKSGWLAAAARALVVSAALCIGACRNDLGKIEAHVEAARCPDAKVIEVTKNGPPIIQQSCLRRPWSEMFLVMSITGTSHIATEPIQALHRRVLWKVSCFTEECRVSQIKLLVDESGPLVLNAFDLHGQTPKRQKIHDGVYSMVLSEGEKLTADFARGRLIYSEADSMADASGEAACTSVANAADPGAEHQ